MPPVLLFVMQLNALGYAFNSFDKCNTRLYIETYPF